MCLPREPQSSQLMAVPGGGTSCCVWRRGFLLPEMLVFILFPKNSWRSSKTSQFKPWQLEVKSPHPMATQGCCGQMPRGRQGRGLQEKSPQLGGGNGDLCPRWGSCWLLMPTSLLTLCHLQLSGESRGLWGLSRFQGPQKEPGCGIRVSAGTQY